MNIYFAFLILQLNLTKTFCFLGYHGKNGPFPFWQKKKRIIVELLKNTKVQRILPFWILEKGETALIGRENVPRVHLDV